MLKIDRINYNYMQSYIKFFLVISHNDKYLFTKTMKLEKNGFNKHYIKKTTDKSVIKGYCLGKEINFEEFYNEKFIPLIKKFCDDIGDYEKFYKERDEQINNYLKLLLSEKIDVKKKETSNDDLANSRFIVKNENGKNVLVYFKNKKIYSVHFIINEQGCSKNCYTLVDDPFNKPTSKLEIIDELEEIIKKHKKVRLHFLF